MHSLQINYADGSCQVINPTDKFDKDYGKLAEAIASGREYTFKILK
jgi:hypothetical protein